MEEKVLKILSEIRPDIDFAAEKKLIDDGIIESFDVIQIVTAIMDDFDIYIDADDIEPDNLNSYEAICEMVKRKMAE